MWKLKSISRFEILSINFMKDYANLFFEKAQITEFSMKLLPLASLKISKKKFAFSKLIFLSIFSARKAI